MQHSTAKRTILKVTVCNTAQYSLLCGEGHGMQQTTAQRNVC